MPKKLTAPVLLIGSSCEASDIKYASGFHPLDPVVFLDLGRTRYLVVPALELGRAQQETNRVRVVTPEQLPLTGKQRRSLSGWALGVLRQAGVRHVCVSPFFPLALADRLRKSKIRITVSHGPVYPRRAIKTADELKCIRASQRAAVAAMKAAIDVLSRSRISASGFLMQGRNKLTSEQVRVVIETTLLQHNTLARETIVAGGRQGADPHNRGSGPLRAGEPIVIDIFPQHKEHGYWGDITRTVVKGAPRPEVQKMYAAVKAAQANALSRLRPGVKGSAVHEGVAKLLAGRGFTTTVSDKVAEGFFHSTGHGVGLDIHEAPSVSTRGGALRAGHVVTIEPGLYYPALGGVRIEDTVVITKTGWKYLAPLEKRFHV